MLIWYRVGGGHRLGCPSLHPTCPVPLGWVTSLSHPGGDHILGQAGRQLLPAPGARWAFQGTGTPATLLTWPREVLQLESLSLPAHLPLPTPPCTGLTDNIGSEEDPPAPVSHRAFPQFPLWDWDI